MSMNFFAIQYLTTCSPSDEESRKEEFVFTGTRLVAVCASVHFLSHPSPGLLFHALYYHTESDWRARIQQRPRLFFGNQQAALCTFVLATVLSFSVGNKTASKEGKSQSPPDTPAFI